VLDHVGRGELLAQPVQRRDERRHHHQHPEAKRRGLMHSLQIKTAAEYPLPGSQGKSVLLKIWPKGVPER
jgi:hypothetical protein